MRRLREHPIHRCAVPLPQGGRLRRYEDTAFLALLERIHAYVEKRITTDKASLEGAESVTTDCLSRDDFI